MLHLLVIVIAIFCFIFWCKQLYYLMEMTNDQFNSDNDKLIWALVILLANFIGALIFRVWRCNHLAVEPSGSLLQDQMQTTQA